MKQSLQGAETCQQQGARSFRAGRARNTSSIKMAPVGTQAPICILSVEQLSPMRRPAHLARQSCLIYGIGAAGQNGSCYHRPMQKPTQCPSHTATTTPATASPAGQLGIAACSANAAREKAGSQSLLADLLHRGPARPEPSTTARHMERALFTAQAALRDPDHGRQLHTGKRPSSGLSLKHN